MIRHVSHTLRERSHTQRSITYDHILHSQTKTSTCIRKSPSRSSRVQNLQRPATAGPMPVQDTTAAQTFSCPFYIGYEKRWTAPDVPVSRPVHNTTADSQLCPRHCEQDMLTPNTYLLLDWPRHRNTQGVVDCELSIVGFAGVPCHNKLQQVPQLLRVQHVSPVH